MNLKRHLGFVRTRRAGWRFYYILSNRVELERVHVEVSVQDVKLVNARSEHGAYDQKNEKLVKACSI